MTTITPTPSVDFNSDLQEVITKFEGDVRRIYVDHLGIPTMGVGFALITRDVDKDEFGNLIDETYQYREGSKDNLQTFLESKEISLSASDWQRLDRVVELLNNGQVLPQETNDGGIITFGDWSVDMAAIHNEILPAVGDELEGVLDQNRNSFSFSLDNDQVAGENKSVPFFTGF